MKPYKVGLVGLRRGSSLVRPFEVFPETQITALRDFIDAVKANRRPLVDAVAAAQMTALGICAHESALKGGQWIDVPTFQW